MVARILSAPGGAGKSAELGEQCRGVLDALFDARLGAGALFRGGLDGAGEHAEERLVERASCGRELLRDLLAFGVVLDHGLDAAQLTLDALQAQHEVLLVAFVADAGHAALYSTGYRLASVRGACNSIPPRVSCRGH